MSRADDQPGLRWRLAHEARRVSAQHGYLDALVATTRRAVEREGEAREALRAFRGALESHFALEEQVHFPALQGLHPELASELTELTREHAAFRASLEHLERQAEGVGTALDALSASLRVHENREEHLLDGAGRTL